MDMEKNLRSIINGYIRNPTSEDAIILDRLYGRTKEAQHMLVLPLDPKHLKPQDFDDNEKGLTYIPHKRIGLAYWIFDSEKRFHKFLLKYLILKVGWSKIIVSTPSKDVLTLQRTRKKSSNRKRAIKDLIHTINETQNGLWTMKERNRAASNTITKQREEIRIRESALKTFGEEIPRLKEKLATQTLLLEKLNREMKRLKEDNADMQNRLGQGRIEK